MPLPDKARSHAILIGTGGYQSAALPDLPSVANNLAALRAALTAPEHGSFAPGHCLVIEDPADQSQVAKQLADVASATEDVLLVYYTGHGLVGTRRQELFLGLAATDPARPQYSALPFAWIRDELLDSIAATKVLILDCCFSGLAVDGFLADQDALVQGQVSVRGTYTLAATPANMAALAPPGARYTAFSGELLALLRDGVPAGPRELDLHLIYQRLARRMREEGWPTPKQYGTDNVLQLALGHNPALGAASPPPAVQRRAAPLEIRPAAAPVVRRPRANGDKPHLNVGVIGDRGHGKTTLTAAITRVLHDENPQLTKTWTPEVRADRIADRTEKHHTVPINITRIKYETGRHQFEHVDQATHQGLVMSLISGAVRLNAAIVAVDLRSGPLTQTREHLLLAQQVGVPYVVVALTFADQNNDEVSIETIEHKMRDLLTEHGYPGYEVPVVRVSAQGALRGEPRWVRSVRNLVTVIEDYVPEPVAEQPFLMAVEDVFTITGRGTVVTGRVDRGRIPRGADAELVGVRIRRTVIDSVEKFRKRLEVAEAGENVGLLLRGVPHEEVTPGEVVAAPGTATAHSHFEALLYLVPDAGQVTQAAFHFHTVDVPGTLTVLAAPPIGKTVAAAVRLTRPVAMAEGQRFAIRREDRTIGFGVMTATTTSVDLDTQERVPIPPLDVQRQFRATLDAINPDIVHGKLDKAVSRARDVCQAWKTCHDEASHFAAVAARFSSPRHPNGWDQATVIAIASAIAQYLQPKQ
jgi:elongation factor Tu